MFNKMKINKTVIGKVKERGSKSKDVKSKMDKDKVIVAPVVETIIDFDRHGHSKAELSVMGREIVSEKLKTPLVDGKKYDLEFMGKKIAVLTQSSFSEQMAGGVMAGWVRDENITEIEDAEILVFLRVAPKEDLVWFGGWIPKEEFFKKAKRKLPGDKVGCVVAVDTGWNLNFDYMADITTLGVGKFIPRRPS